MTPIKASVYTNDLDLTTVKIRVGGAIFVLELGEAMPFAELLLARIEEKRKMIVAEKQKEIADGQEV